MILHIIVSGLNHSPSYSNSPKAQNPNEMFQLPNNVQIKEENTAMAVDQDQNVSIKCSYH